ncbi:MAG: ABC transporter permease [Proteobacteria bacterium]|nr:MAG: ABC transporter permease [Pseudomonadota bacterium]
MRSLRGAIGLATVLAAWQLLAMTGLINPVLMPSPARLVDAIIELLRDGSLLIHLTASLERVFAGFVLAALCGLTLGVLTGWWRPASDFLKPIIESLRPIPPIAWTPLAILWFGVGNAPSYFLVFIGAVFPIFVNTFAAVRNIDRTQINAALCLGAGRRLLLTDVLIPASLPVIFPGLRIALGIGWMCVVTAELVAAQSGLGYLIQQSRLLLQTQNVLAGMITIGAVGFAMNAVMERIEWRLTGWSHAARS